MRNFQFRKTIILLPAITITQTLPTKAYNFLIRFFIAICYLEGLGADMFAEWSTVSQGSIVPPKNEFSWNRYKI